MHKNETGLTTTAKLEVKNGEINNMNTIASCTAFEIRFRENFWKES